MRGRRPLLESKPGAAPTRREHWGLTRVAMCLIDLTELDLPSTMKTNFPDPADLLNFTLTITPDEGAYPMFIDAVAS